MNDISRLPHHSKIEPLAADLEDGSPWPLVGRQFGAAVVTNYLHRPLMPQLLDTIAPGASLPLQFRALDAAGRVVPDRVPQWSSSDPGIEGHFGCRRPWAVTGPRVIQGATLFRTKYVVKNNGSMRVNVRPEGSFIHQCQAVSE